MHLTLLSGLWSSGRCRRILPLLLFLLVVVAGSSPLMAAEEELKLPDLSAATFMGSVSGPVILKIGLGVSLLGFAFGLAMYTHLRNLPVHESMLEISELIYETCKTYLLTQGKFLMVLELFIGTIIVFYFGFLRGLAATFRSLLFWRSTA